MITESSSGESPMKVTTEKSPNYHCAYKSKRIYEAIVILDYQVTIYH